MNGKWYICGKKRTWINVAERERFSHLARGFSNPVTMELMLRRANRHKKLATNAARRKKMADPQQRLAMFHRTSGHQGQGRDKELSPSPTQTTTKEKQELVYQ